MEKLIKGFISWAELRDGSEKGKADRQRNALYFLSYCEEKKLTDAAAIGRNILDEYSRYLREERGYTEDSVKNRRNTVIFFLSYLRDEKGLKILYHREREAEKAALPDLPEGLLRVYLEYVSWMEQKGHRKITVYRQAKERRVFSHLPQGKRRD